MWSGEQDSEERIVTLEAVLNEIDQPASRQQRISVGQIIDVVGERAFSPLILAPGLIMLAPGLGDIPGVPVLMGLIVILVVVQMLLRRRYMWFPGWLRRRSAKGSTVHKTVGWLRKPARFVDRWSRPRYTWALHHAGFIVIAVCCIAVAAATPLMEVVPFSANLAGVVITAFGVALVARDGLIALLAMALAVGTGVLVGFQLL